MTQSSNSIISQPNLLANYDPFYLNAQGGAICLASKTLKLMQQFVTSQYVKANDPLAIVPTPSRVHNLETDSRIDNVVRCALTEAGQADQTTLLASVKLQKQSLIAFQTALSGADQSVKEQAYRALPTSIKEILSYVLWHQHGCPQKTGYGENTLLEDLSVLSSIQTPYLHPQGKNIIEQAINSIEDKIRLLEAKKTVEQIEQLKELCQGTSNNAVLLKALTGLKEQVQWDLHYLLQEYAREPQHVKDQTKHWGRVTAEGNVRRLLTTRDASDKKNLLEKVIAKHTDEFNRLLSEQTDREIEHFKRLVDSNALTHRHLYKIYKSLDSVKRASLEQPYQPPYYGKGLHADLHTFYGSHITGNSVVFRVYAPNAKEVSVVIFQNGQGCQIIPMQKKAAGNWELRTDDAKVGTVYEYLIKTQEGGLLRKADPYARQNKEVSDAVFRDGLNNGNHRQVIETYFRQVSVVAETKFNWTDGPWMSKRAQNTNRDSARNIYELHVSSWKRKNGEIMNWKELAVELAEHCKRNNFTHVELFGVMDHILDLPYTGYQPTAFFAPNHRLGSSTDFKAFVDHMHDRGIGVFLDWVPGHFGINESSLHHFDGTPLYEHHDLRRAYQKNWNVINFNFEQPKVCDFLFSNAKAWLDEYHIDGLRFDAVTNIARTDLFKEESFPHYKGGKWNSDALNFIRDANAFIHDNYPGAITVAEEFEGEVASTHSPSEKFSLKGAPLMRGLGFDEKWALGWMYYMSGCDFLAEKPEHRKYHREPLFLAMKMDTFDQQIHERTVRAFSHDETGNRKGSILERMQKQVPCSEESLPSKFADLRAFYAQQICLPGSKLSFMGNEFAQTKQWSDQMFIANGISGGYDKIMTCFIGPEERKIGGVDWDQLVPGSRHGQHMKFVAAFNDLYLKEEALWGNQPESIQWFHTADSGQRDGRPIVAYFRKSNDPSNQLICINNFGDTMEQEYNIMLPAMQSNPVLEYLEEIEEIFNTDDLRWGGEGRINTGALELIWKNNDIIGFKVCIAPQSGIILRPKLNPPELMISCELPPEKSLFIRGSESPLGWNSHQAIKLQRNSDGTWRVPVNLTKAIEYKILLDNQEWEEGPNHSFTPGIPSTHRPKFSALPAPVQASSVVSQPAQQDSIKTLVLKDVGFGNTLAVCCDPLWDKKPLAFTHNGTDGWSGHVPVGKDFKFVVLKNGNIIKWEGSSHRKFDGQTSSVTIESDQVHFT